LEHVANYGRRQLQVFAIPMGQQRLRWNNRSVDNPSPSQNHQDDFEHVASKRGLRPLVGGLNSIHVHDEAATVPASDSLARDLGRQRAIRDLGTGGVTRSAFAHGSWRALNLDAHAVGHYSWITSLQSRLEQIRCFATTLPVSSLMGWCSLVSAPHSGQGTAGGVGADSKPADTPSVNPT